jgi:YidC/Oxa1 family membrane protein insertase
LTAHRASSGGFLDAIGQFWNAALVNPLSEALIFFAAATGSAGWAIILFTIVVKIVLFPLTWQQIKSQRSMMVIQPQIKAAQKKHGKDRQKLSEETMRIYKEHNVNPASGCLPLLIQMPIWFALYQALMNLGNENPVFQEPFWWLPNLAQHDPFYILPVLTAVTQWGIQRMMTPPTVDAQQEQMNRMMQIMPIMFLFFSLQFPAGLVLYWVTSNVVSFVQQYFLTGWGGLFPNGYKPNTPLAGSWESPDPARLAVEDEEEDTTSSARGKSRPGDGQDGASTNGQRGRSPSRASKEKKRSAKR